MMPENSGSDASNQEDLSTISGDVTNAINQLPESAQAGLPGIRELLTQLHSRIEGNNDLPDGAKAEALQQVKVLADAGKNPQAESKRSHAATAIKALRVMFKEPKSTNFIEACTQLLPDIAEIFGLE